MASDPKLRLDLYALSFRLPILVWQALFFVGPLAFMLAMSSCNSASSCSFSLKAPRFQTKCKDERSKGKYNCLKKR